MVREPVPKPDSLRRTPTDGRPQLVDLGMPVFTDPPVANAAMTPQLSISTSPGR
ncbi:hypothetical protein [Streptomyces fagopyri]|uniref:hypothetical protein n=1 Tax=Streptomyces fagopyri TaxID=2662397 RepID=UPI0037114B4A